MIVRNAGGGRDFVTIEGEVLRCDFYGCRAEALIDVPSMDIGPEFHRDVREIFAERGWASKSRDRWRLQPIDFCPDHIPKRQW